MPPCLEMEQLQRLVENRNAVETTPFLAVHAANTALQSLVDTFQSRCMVLEKERADLHQQVDELMAAIKSGKRSSSSLKNETRLRDKVEKLQEELNDKLRLHSDASTKALETATELSKMKDINTAQEATITNLRNENLRNEDVITQLQTDLQEAKHHSALAEQQYNGLKDTIRVLQEENDELKDTNGKLVERLVTDKEKMMDQINKMNEMVERMQKELDMLRLLKKQEDKKSQWIGRMKDKDHEKQHGSKSRGGSHGGSSTGGRRFGIMGSVIPTKPQQIIHAHSSEATCVRYDGGGGGSNFLATAGNDATVKIWDTQSGSLRATLRGAPNHPILSCDISGELAVGSGSDKTCRVWNVRTERMLHQLAGHSNKISCVRLVKGGKLVLTGSFDRSLKLWDISRNTYRQTTTFRHSSTTHCIDIGSSDVHTAASGHMDGGVRFWDIRCGGGAEQVLDLPRVHGSDVTSVTFHPTNSTHVLTNGRDSCLRVIDIRNTCQPIHTLIHPEFKTLFKNSAASFSPDGKYVAAGSNANGCI